jgi:transglutaminase-like putative cysteine protease
VRFAVRHDTRYRYSTPVVLAPHLLRLTPRPGHHVRSRSLVVHPAPTELREEIDAFGNPVARATFDARPIDELRIESRFELDTTAPLVTDGAAPLALLPWPSVDTDLAPYGPSASNLDAGVTAFARALASEVAHAALPFLDRLCRTIHARTDRHIRPTGDAQTPAETLASRRGACRDLTVLFLAAARSLGMAARFCSGYQAAADTPDGRRYLHAWPEVFLPGLGWRGWDPTHGLPVADGHVALSTAPFQADTMPVTGGFYASGAVVRSTLDFVVEIATAASPAFLA